jgi:membrane protein
MKLTGSKLFKVFKTAGTDWSNDKAPRLGAALAYYTVFSIAPLIIIVIAIAGLWLEPKMASQQIFSEISGLVGTKGAETIQSMLVAANKPREGTMATIIAVVTLVLGASGVFIQLQDALNSIWEVRQQPHQGIMGFIKTRILSFTMILTVGFLLLVSLVLSAGIAAAGKYFGGGSMAGVWSAVNFLVSFGVIVVLFALMFKFLPDVKVPWSDVWVGAVVTALLFVVGKYLLGVYLGRSATESTYGAAGSMVVVLLWVYWSSQILFFGAELTQAFSYEMGHNPVPKKHAEWSKEYCDSDEKPDSKENPARPEPLKAPGGGRNIRPLQPSLGSFKPLPVLVLLLLAVLPLPKLSHRSKSLS